MSFTRMMHAASHLFPKFYHHPFNQALQQGNLPRSVFRDFIWQDAPYLEGLAKALDRTSEQFESMKNIQRAKQLKNIAAEIRDTELNLHRKYLDEKYNPGFFNTTPLKKSSVISNHTTHLLRTATYLSIYESTGSLLPCFVMYHLFSKQIKITPDHPYYPWLSSYSNKQFSDATNIMIEIADELGHSPLYPIYADKMGAGFVRSVEFEIEFLDHILAVNTLQPFHRCSKR